MNTKLQVNTFLNSDPIAIMGVSRNPKKFGHIVYKTLYENGYHLIPVNRNKGEINGVTFENSISTLGNDIQKVLIVTHKRDTTDAIKEAIAKGIKNIWIQNGCETPEAIELAKLNNVNLIYKSCILMYANPKGIHKFHGIIARLFGGQLK